MAKIRVELEIAVDGEKCGSCKHPRKSAWCPIFNANRERTPRKAFLRLPACLAATVEE
jgi:hypothetical protein